MTNSSQGALKRWIKSHSMWSKKKAAKAAVATVQWLLKEKNACIKPQSPAFAKAIMCTNTLMPRKYLLIRCFLISFKIGFKIYKNNLKLCVGE